MQLASATEPQGLSRTAPCLVRAAQGARRPLAIAYTSRPDRKTLHSGASAASGYKSDAPARTSSQQTPQHDIDKLSKPAEVSPSKISAEPSQRSARSDALAEDLENLHIRPEDSDQTSTSRVEPEKEEDEEYVSLLTQMRKALLTDGTTPKQVLEPILETFDLQGIASYIKNGKAKKIIVMCGAGISVSAGIPDFRSPKTGLYNNLQKYKLPHPQAVFELDYFRRKPDAFYMLAKELFPGNYKPTPAHYFMTLLEQKGMLLRCFTQNIDSLERQAGLSADRIIAAHGNFDTAHCIDCRDEVALETVREAVMSERPCRCPTCGGLVKPDIVFFGENLPEAFFRNAKSDFPQADLLIVMGTSLVVHPFASLIDHVEKHVPRILINRERVGEADASLLLMGQMGGFRFEEGYRDALFLGDCDVGVLELAKTLGWESDLEALISAGHQDKEPIAKSDL